MPTTLTKRIAANAHEAYHRFITDAPAFSDLKWRDEGHPHYLTAFFKGPGKRAVTAYDQLAGALAETGIQVTATTDRGGSPT